MTGSDFDWMVSNHAVWGWKAPVKASVSGVSLLQLSPFFASIFPLFPRNAWYSGLPPDMRTRALVAVPCIPAIRFSKWRTTNQNLTRHCRGCEAAVLALRIWQPWWTEPVIVQPRLTAVSERIGRIRFTWRAMFVISFGDYFECWCFEEGQHFCVS